MALGGARFALLMEPLALGPEIEGDDYGEYGQKIMTGHLSGSGQIRKDRREDQCHDALDAQQIAQAFKKDGVHRRSPPIEYGVNP